MTWTEQFVIENNIKILHSLKSQNK